MSQTDLKTSRVERKSMNKTTNRYEQQMARHHVWTNTHLIRQKKDFSCMQSDGDDSETGKERF